MVVPASNTTLAPGLLNGFSIDCAADSEKVARRPNARVKKRILLVVVVGSSY